MFQAEGKSHVEVREDGVLRVLRGDQVKGSIVGWGKAGESFSLDLCKCMSVRGATWLPTVFGRRPQFLTVAR